MVYANPSPLKNTRKKVRTTDFGAMKKEGKRISALTCYDHAFARILEKTPLDVVLVGDSLGHVIQGQTSTLKVSIEEIAYHVRCVASALKTPLLVADMPFSSSGISTERTFKHAALLLQAGAEAVKIEGASDETCQKIDFLVRHGVPVMGHVGLLPQSIHTLGGYKVQGKKVDEGMLLLEQAHKLERAGCFALVLELVSEQSARTISAELSIPTIGIGCGNQCDGNILVLQDMLGMNDHFKPKFLKHFAYLENIVGEAIHNYCTDVGKACSEPPAQ